MSAEAEAVAAAEGAKRGGSSKFLWIVIAFLTLVLLAGAGAWYTGLLGGTAEEDAESVEIVHEPVYFTLADRLVVNFRGGGSVRFLQVGVELMTYDPDAVAAIEAHSSVLLNNLILLLSDQTQEDLASREGKEAVRLDALEESRAVMEELYGEPAIESLYFTTFVMQ